MTLFNKYWLSGFRAPLPLAPPMKFEGSKILFREEREGGRERTGLGDYEST